MFIAVCLNKSIIIIIIIIIIGLYSHYNILKFLFLFCPFIYIFIYLFIYLLVNKTLYKVLTMSNNANKKIQQKEKKI